MSNYMYPESELREEVYRMRNDLSVGTQISDHEVLGDINPDSYNIPKAIIDVAISGDYVNHPKLYRSGAVHICSDAGYPVPVHIAMGGDLSLIEQSVRHALRHLAEIHAVSVSDLVDMWHRGEYTFGTEMPASLESLQTHRLGGFEVNGTSYSASDIKSIELTRPVVKIDIAGDVIEFPFSDVYALAQVFNAIVEVSEHSGFKAPSNSPREVETVSWMSEALGQMHESVKAGDIGKSRDIMHEASAYMQKQGNCDVSELRGMMDMFNGMGAGEVREARISIFDPTMMSWSVRTYNEGTPTASQVDHYDQIDEDMRATLYNRYVEEVVNA